MGIESVAKRESFQRGKQSEGRCMLNMCDFQLTGGGSGTDNCLQICSIDSADQNVTSGILSVSYGYYPKLGPCSAVLRRPI